MKKFIILFTFFNIVFLSLGEKDKTVSSLDSTFIRERSNIHIQSIGIFDPLRISINKIHELRIQPLSFFLIPNVTFERHWYGKRHDDDVARFLGHYHTNFYSTHSVTFPTLLLNVLTKEGIGGLLPTNSEIPFIFTTKHQLFFEHFIIPTDLAITIGGGVEFGFHGKDSDFPPIEYPIIFPRTHVYNNDYLLQGDFKTSIKLSQRAKFAYVTPHSSTLYWLDLRTTYFHLPTNTKNYMALEEALTLRRESWKKTYKLGIKYSYGSYAFGTDDGFFPYFDLIFKFH